MHIVLIGYRGSGKSSIGRHLAETLKRPFIDLDDVINARAGMPIRDIFAKLGEGRFRELESEALHAALAKNESHVIAPGGGAAMAEVNRQRIIESRALIVYLHASADALSKRIAADAASKEARPSLSGVASAADEVAVVLASREPIYRQMAHVVVDVTNLSLEQAKAKTTDVAQTRLAEAQKKKV